MPINGNFNKNNSYNKLSKFPSLLLSTCLFMTLACFVIFFLYITASEKLYQNITDTSMRANIIKGEMMRIDEVLTMSAIMAAYSGKSEWEDRYKLNESVLDNYIKELTSLVIDKDSLDFTIETKLANEKLVSIEYKAFDLVRKSKKDEAIKLLNSTEYKKQKQIYSNAMKEFSQLMQIRIDKANKKNEHIVDILAICVAVTIILLLICWLKLIKSIKKWRHQLIKTHKKNIKIKRDLIKINENLNKSAYIISHDIQESLRSVYSFSQILFATKKKTFSAEERTYIKFIQENIIRIRELINEILANAMQMSQSIEIKAIDCNVVLEEVKTNLAQLIKSSNATIKPFGNLPIINGNKVQVIQLFQNLIANAIKYRSSSDPKIDIISYEDNEKITLIFSDNGIGIAKNNINHIFNKFVQIDKTKQGSGLGLNICKEIVESYNGQIWVESKLGNGSKFFIEIPKQQNDNKNNDTSFVD